MIKNVNRYIIQVKTLMYGFGDDEQPLDETADVLDDCLTDFLSTLLKRCYKRAQRADPNSHEISEEDVLYFLKGDFKKYSRVLHILKNFKDVKDIKKNLDPESYKKKENFN